jgi:hypothetical protein
MSLLILQITIIQKYVRDTCFTPKRLTILSFMLSDAGMEKMEVKGPVPC